MPTNLPRLQVTLTVEQHNLITQMARMTRMSGAGFIRRFIDEATPLLRALAPVIDRIDADDKERAYVVEHVFSELMSDWRELGYFDQLDLLDHVDQQGGGVAAQRPEDNRGGRGRASPRIVTRGSGISEPSAKQRTSGR